MVSSLQNVEANGQTRAEWKRDGIYTRRWSSSLGCQALSWTKSLKWRMLAAGAAAFRAGQGVKCTDPVIANCVCV